MKAKLKAYLETVYSESRAHDETQTERAACWRNLHPDSAALLAVLVRAKQARKVLEVGTSNGYSTLWLADAVRDTGGSLCTLEIDKARKKAARQNLREAKLEDFVRMEVCDAGEFLRDYQNISMWCCLMPTAVNTPPIGRICSAFSPSPAAFWW
jgi:predicted O-methyltransferase YrrM